MHTAKPGEDKVDLKEQHMLTGGADLTPSAGVRRRGSNSSAMSDKDSSCSEQERPPHFEAEMSGSEISETTKEYHARIFGAIGEDEPTTEPESSNGDAQNAKAQKEDQREVPLPGVLQNSMAPAAPLQAASPPVNGAKTNLASNWQEDGDKAPLEPAAQDPDRPPPQKHGACCVFC